MRELLKRLEEATPTGKAQNALMAYLKGEGKKWGKKHNLADIPYKLVKVEFGALMKAAEVLAKKGIITLDVVKGKGNMVSLKEDLDK